MLRFMPDGWLEGLLRPLLMVDPQAYLYLEMSAPDWRFAVLAALLLVLRLAALKRSSRPPIGFQQGIAALGLLVTFYVWTFVSGNGRYFAWGLLLVGPVLVMAALLLPVSRSLRWTGLVLVLGVQGVVLHFSDIVNPWAVVRAQDKPMALQASALRDKPAVFLTVSNLSYSILVPLFHPASRWAAISGQYDVLPGTVEWPRLQRLLQSPLPQYLVLTASPGAMDKDGQPCGRFASVARDTLYRHGLTVSAAGCEFLQSRLTSPGWQVSEQEVGQWGFLVCALSRGQAPADMAPSDRLQTPPQVDDANERALDVVEQRCPRYFPPGAGRASLVVDLNERIYASTDMRLWIRPNGVVAYHYFRAADATALGSVSDVLAGRFSLPCRKLSGRYVPFWQSP